MVITLATACLSALLLVEPDAAATMPADGQRRVAYQEQISRDDDAVVACSWLLEHGAMFEFQVTNTSDKPLALSPEQFRVVAVLLTGDGREKPDRLTLSSGLTWTWPEDAEDGGLRGPSAGTRAQGVGSWNHVERKPYGSPTIEPSAPAGVRAPPLGGRSPLVRNSPLRLERQRLAPGAAGGGLLQWNVPRATVAAFDVEANLKSGTHAFRFTVKPEPEAEAEE